nr:uncharacterized protein LOC110561516 [Meriones unguiculatus]
MKTVSTPQRRDKVYHFARLRQSASEARLRTPEAPPACQSPRGPARALPRRPKPRGAASSRTGSSPASLLTQGARRQTERDPQGVRGPRPGRAGERRPEAPGTGAPRAFPQILPEPSAKLPKLAYSKGREEISGVQRFSE